MVNRSCNPDEIQVRLTQNLDEVRASQALRYQVFYDEYGATPTLEILKEQRDINEFDPITDHLIVVDNDRPEGDRIIGTYRLLRQKIAEKYGKFYTSDEYNIQPLLDNEKNLLELGRSCVLSSYRTRPVLQKLWEGIAHYIADNNIGLMFGCASITGTDVDKASKILAYLHHYHKAPDEICPKAIPSRYIDMNLHKKEDLNASRIFGDMPPLLKGYLRLGAYIGDGAVIDEQWNSIDVCIVLPSAIVSEKYVKHYERKTNKVIPAGEKMKNSKTARAS